MLNIFHFLAKVLAKAMLHRGIEIAKSPPHARLQNVNLCRQEYDRTRRL